MFDLIWASQRRLLGRLSHRCFAEAVPHRIEAPGAEAHWVEHDAVEARLLAFGGHEREAAGSGRQPIPHDAVAGARGSGRVSHHLDELGARPRDLQAGARCAREQPVDVDTEPVQPAVHQRAGVEDAVAPVNHVIVERHGHDGGIGDDPAEIGAEHGVTAALAPPPGGHPLDGFGGAQDPLGRAQIGACLVLCAGIAVHVLVGSWDRPQRHVPILRGLPCLAPEATAAMQPSGLNHPAPPLLP